MAKRYIFVRMPIDIFQKYIFVKNNLENNIEKIIKKPIRLTMPKVFDAVVSQDVNIDLSNCLIVKIKKNEK